MNNCLETKLVGSVDIPYLRKTNDVVSFFKSGINTTLRCGNLGTYEVYNMAGVLQGSYTNYALTFAPNYDGFVRIKNNANGLGLAALDNNFKAENFATFDITSSVNVSNSNFEDTLENIIKWWPNITVLNIKDTKVTGNLDSMLDQNDALVIPTLTDLDITRCQITCKRSTINKILAILTGTHFKYTGTIIIEDVQSNP